MKKDIKTYLFAAVSLCLFSHRVLAQATGDFKTDDGYASGDWNDPTTWNRYSSSSVWEASGVGENTGLTPTSSSSVWIQTGTTVTLTQNEPCNDLHICTNTTSTPNTINMGLIDLQTFTLSVNGRLVCYYGGTGIIPGSNTTVGYAQYPFMGSSGKVSVEGNTRNLTSSGEWSAIIVTQNGIFPVEINLTSGQTITLQTGLTCSSLSVVSSGTTTFSGNVTCGGDLSIGNNTLDIGATTLNINGDFTSGASGAIKSNGSGSVSIAGTGTLTSALTFDQTIPGTTNRIQSLTLNRGTSPGTGSATLGNTLEITGTLTLTNGTLNTGGFLTLVSNVSTTARVATIPATADISGNVKVQRYVPAVTRRYRMFSPNTTGFAFSDMIDNIFVTGTGGATNGFDNSTTNSPSIYTYQESTGGSGRGWKAVTNITQGLSSGEGALVFVRGDRSLSGWNTSPFPSQNAVTVDFNGPVNKGTITPTIFYTNTADPASDGWNLIGNPYPSQIDWTALSKSNLDGNYYVFDPISGSYVANSGSNLIASGQAFFVQATGASPTISFVETVKVATAPTSYFKTGLPQIEIKMVKDSLNSDVAWLEFNSAASKFFNRGEDALKFTNSVINFGFYIDSVFTTQRNSVPMPLIADTFILSAYASSGNYTLQFANVASSLPSSKNIYLRDMFNSNLINLRTTSTYAFSITSSSASCGNRFQLIINDPSMLPVKLIDFYAEKEPNTNEVLLHWSTSSEHNSDRFVVERAIDNSNKFSEIGNVSAKNNSQTTAIYQFKDLDFPGQNTQTIFYRLKEIDKDGSSVYSKIVSVNLSTIDEKALVVYPNPASETLRIKSGSQFQGNMNIAVYNIVGKCIVRNDVFVTKGQEITLDIFQFQTGVYIVKLTQPLTGKQSFAKFTKE